MASLAQQMAARGEKVPGTGRNFYEKLGLEKYVVDLGGPWRLQGFPFLCSA